MAPAGVITAMAQETSKRTEAVPGATSDAPQSSAKAIPPRLPQPEVSPPPLPTKDGPAAQPPKVAATPAANPPPLLGPNASAGAKPAQPAVPATPEAAAAAADKPTEQEQSSRRTAKRRPAGPPRARVAANDDLPSIGGLIFALHEKPSQRPMQIAAIASVAWGVCGILLGWAMLAPELQRVPTVLEMLTRPTAITLAATIILPIAVFWFIALLVWRAQELRLMSSAMTEVAIRLAEPDRMAEQQIASVGQAVRRQVNHMNEAVSRALGRAGELEALVHNEVASLERSYTQNENRIRGLLDELAGERNALLNTSERVSHTLKELGNDIPTLVEKLSEQQVKLARFIEQAGQNLVSLEQSIAVNATQLATSVGARTQELHGVLTDRAAEISGLLESRTGDIAAALQTGKTDLENTLATHTEDMQAAFDGFAGGLDAALGERNNQLKVMLTDTASAIESTLATRTEGLQTVLEEYTRALDATMEARQQGLDQQLLQRTKALDDAFSERIKLFDDSILRSTIAIDSTVADKARALSTALETHAHEIAQVLGRQAGQLDEQIMHGVNAIRRASENVTRQSVQAIEGLAGQAELLRNLSDNVVGQIATATERFDKQGQSMIRAAGALETVNQRIDQGLRHQQAELTRTIEHLSAKTEDIDKVMRAYPASLEGTVSKLESRALSASEHLARGVEEQSRRAISEMERLRSTAGGDAERAAAELREKFQNISREVSQEIGTLQSRFTSSYDDMRQRAHRTLADIESEQMRLKQELERLPEATRASAETMRQSLQEQLKALEQLSTLTRREAQRTEVSPPIANSAIPMPSAGRAISSVTQTLANELAARGHRPQAALPAGPADNGRGDGWKLGELLARASQEEGGFGDLNLPAYGRALDQTTASAIWSRFRAGQRGVMVRSIYTVEGRTLFDEVQRRYAADQAFRQAADRYQHDFQRLMREAEQRDPSGRMAQSYIVSDQGRAYLFLAHASGRLI